MKGQFSSFGNQNLNDVAGNSYTVNLPNGYKAVLTGWTHTRDYHLGFLRNAGGNAYATISDLTPGQEYQFQMWQWSEHDAYFEPNKWSVNGEEYDTGAQSDSSDSAPTTASDVVVADANGEIKFDFTHSINHIVLSGLSIRTTCTATTCEGLDISMPA